MVFFSPARDISGVHPWPALSLWQVQQQLMVILAEGEDGYAAKFAEAERQAKEQGKELLVVQLVPGKVSGDHIIIEWPRSAGH